MSPAQREAQAKMAGAMMPRGFLLRNKTVAPGGQSARLIVSGPGQPLMGDKPETLYGTIQMVMQRGEWKVGESDWTNQQPAALTQPARPAAKAAAQPAAPISTRSTPVVGSMDAAPARKLGKAKEPCVFKPVMTAEDMANCR